MILPGFWDDILVAVKKGLQTWDDPNSFENLDVVLAQRIEQAQRRSQEIEAGMRRVGDTARDSADNFNQSILRIFPAELLRLIPEGSHQYLKRSGTNSFKLDFSSFGDTQNYVITKENGKWVILDPELNRKIPVSGPQGFYIDMPEQQ
jgi:hypothetical protein